MTNLACMYAMHVAQIADTDLPTRHSIIPGTNQKFIYMEDFYTFIWGDMFGVPLIINAFVHLVNKDISNLWWGLPIMLVSALLFLKMCLGKDHKPDFGFPDIGKISLAGILHLFYFGIAIGASVMCIWNLCTGKLTGTTLWVALGGGVFYTGCFILEIKSGNFDPLKRVPEKV